MKKLYILLITSLAIITIIFSVAFYENSEVNKLLAKDQKHLFVGWGMIPIGEFVACKGELYLISENVFICLEKPYDP